MKLIRRSLIALGVMMLVSACAYPVSKSVQTSEQSAIYFTGNLEGALVQVDGVAAGPVIQYNGVDAVLTVPFGAHKVEVMRNGYPALSRDVFVGRGQQLEIKL